MVKRRLPLPLVLLLLATCKENPAGTNTTNPQSVSVLTQHNDNTRSGWNDNETALTTSNVNVQQFGNVFTLTVDDQVYAQPLVVGHVFVGDGYHNVVYIATVNNTENVKALERQMSELDDNSSPGEAVVRRSRSKR